VILAIPGKLVAEVSPVSLKSNLGHGYSVQVTFDSEYVGEKEPASSSLDVLDRIQGCRSRLQRRLCTTSSPRTRFVVEKVLQMLHVEAAKYQIASVDVLGTSRISSRFNGV
jgi:ATP-binding cassette, subfamily A (ABC1), member 3